MKLILIQVLVTKRRWFTIKEYTNPLSDEGAICGLAALFDCPVRVVRNGKTIYQH